jgi:hypothetical protein
MLVQAIDAKPFQEIRRITGYEVNGFWKLESGVWSEGEGEEHGSLDVVFEPLL